MCIWLCTYGCQWLSHERASDAKLHNSLTGAEPQSTECATIVHSFTLSLVVLVIKEAESSQKRDETLALT